MYVLLMISIIIAIILILPLIMPRKGTQLVNMEVDAEINKIYSIISNLKTWPEWTYWSKQSDPDFNPIYEENNSGIMNWEKFHGRAGFLKISNSEKNKMISYIVEVEGMPIKLSGEISLSQINSKKTNVSWMAYADAENNFYLRYFSSLITLAMKNQLKENLENLKKYILA